MPGSRVCQVAGRTYQRRTLCCLGRTLSDEICIAAIPTTFPVSRQLRDMEGFKLSSEQGVGYPGTWLFSGLNSRNDPFGKSHLGPAQNVV